MTKAKAIFFDLGETLVTQNIEDNMVTIGALEKISKLLPIRKTSSQLFSMYQIGYQINQTFRSTHHVEIPIQSWMIQLLRRALRHEPSESLVEEAIQIVVAARARNAKILHRAQSILEKLSRQKRQLGVISNISSHNLAVEILREVGLLGYFDTIVTSAQTGIRKPDLGIFLFALKQFDLDPREAAIVGDSERHDVWGGTITGMKTVLLSRKHVANSLADYQFPSLEKASRTLMSL